MVNVAETLLEPAAYVISSFQFFNPAANVKMTTSDEASLYETFTGAVFPVYL
jgi:hypothetical protein